MGGVDGEEGVRAVGVGLVPSAVDDVREAVVAVWSLLSFLEPVLVSNRELRMSWLRENFSCNVLDQALLELEFLYHLKFYLGQHYNQYQLHQG